MLAQIDAKQFKLNLNMQKTSKFLKDKQILLPL